MNAKVPMDAPAGGRLPDILRERIALDAAAGWLRSATLSPEDVARLDR